MKKDFSCEEAYRTFNKIINSENKENQVKTEEEADAYEHNIKELKLHYLISTEVHPLVNPQNQKDSSKYFSSASAMKSKSKKKQKRGLLFDKYYQKTQYGNLLILPDKF
jgi:hypothetical protein